MSGSPSSQPLQCPLCRHIPDRKHIRNICYDAGQVLRIPEQGLYSDLQSRPYVWLYEGRNNGWWYYDYDMQDLLEEAWCEHRLSIDWLVCGQKTHFDLQGMQQTNLTNNAIRDIKRLAINDVSGLLIKGVAGMMPESKYL